MDLAVVGAAPSDTARLALVSSLAKQTYRRWAGDAWKPPTAASEEQRWRERFTDRHSWVAMALLDTEVVGAVSITMARTDGGRGAEVPGVAHLGRMFVHPERWGRGIGSTLLLRAVAEMKRRGYHAAQLYTGADNTQSRRFYERHGWKPRQGDAGKHDEGIAVVRYALDLSGAGPPNEPPNRGSGTVTSGF